MSAIKFRMEQQGLTQRDLAPFIGSQSKVSEVLSGKRGLTLSMARALHQNLDIPASVLLQRPEADFPNTGLEFQWAEFPIREMANAGWISNGQHLLDHAEELVRDLIERAGGWGYAVEPQFRTNRLKRISAKTNLYALQVWCWQVMASAREQNRPAKYQNGTVTPAFLQSIARLSRFEDGPLRARDELMAMGIGFQVLPHLRKTYLDGAAISLPDGRPVIGLTLRHDRIDNFWFTLLHELAHVGLHFSDCSESALFVDDFDIRKGEGTSQDRKEKEADAWAQTSLIPKHILEEIAAKDWSIGVSDLYYLSGKAEVHPAIIAGRVRYERGNYHLLSQHVGKGEVRKQFIEAVPFSENSY